MFLKCPNQGGFQVGNILPEFTTITKQEKETTQSFQKLEYQQSIKVIIHL